MRDLTWFPRVEMAPLNVVTPRTSSRKIDAELGPPLMRAFAASQRSQLYLTHTMWSAVVMELLCECGDADPAVCGAHSGGGAVAGKGTGFCGLEEPLQAGCASAIFTKECADDTTLDRRLARWSASPLCRERRQQLLLLELLLLLLLLFLAARLGRGLGNGVGVGVEAVRLNEPPQIGEGEVSQGFWRRSRGLEGDYRQRLK